jgi:hypothetical protein
MQLTSPCVHMATGCGGHAPKSDDSGTPASTSAAHAALTAHGSRLPSAASTCGAVKYKAGRGRGRASLSIDRARLLLLLCLVPRLAPRLVLRCCATMPLNVPLLIPHAWRALALCLCLFCSFSAPQPPLVLHSAPPPQPQPQPPPLCPPASPARRRLSPCAGAVARGRRPPPSAEAPPRLPGPRWWAARCGACTRPPPRRVPGARGGAQRRRGRGPPRGRRSRPAPTLRTRRRAAAGRARTAAVWGRGWGRGRGDARVATGATLRSRSGAGARRPPGAAVLSAAFTAVLRLQYHQGAARHLFRT